MPWTLVITDQVNNGSILDYSSAVVKVPFLKRTDICCVSLPNGPAIVTGEGERCQFAGFHCCIFQRIGETAPLVCFYPLIALVIGVLHIFRQRLHLSNKQCAFAACDLALDMCPRYQEWLAGMKKCGIQRFPDTSTHGQCLKLSLRPFDLEFVTQSSHQCDPTSLHKSHATMHQLTTMLATSKDVLFPSHNHLLNTGTDDSTLWLSLNRQQGDE